MEVSVRTTPLILLAVLTSSACYQYFPVYDTDPLPEAGAEVRIQLESPQPLDLGTMTINDVGFVEGHVHRSDSDSLSLFSSKLRTFYGFRQHTNGAVFEFDRSQLDRVEERKLVPWKTGVAIGVTAVGLGVAMYYAVGLGGGNEDPRQPTEPGLGKSANIPLLKILVPLLFP